VDAVVAALFVYPVKSCRGISLERSRLEPRGLQGDRRWMIVDGEGRFITQRTEPRLALVGVALEEDAVVLRAEGQPDLRVSASPPEGAARRRVRIFRDDVEAVDCGEEAARWTTRWLAYPASLVFMPDDVRRPVRPDHAPADAIVSFADAFPLLVASTSSLGDLNRRLADPLPMDRFRPNVVVSGCAPWAEDQWKDIRIGSTAVRIAKPCERCVITTTDQRTGERGMEPLRTLATFRRRGHDVLFAQNGIPGGPGTFAVGDPITVLERRTPEPFDRAPHPAQ
jgi:uncharacterized protein YcbX